MQASVQLRGEGGSIWEFDLPLSETYADQVRRGRLEPADPESEELLAASGVLGDVEAQPEGPQAPPVSGAGSGRAAWAAYAAEIGIEVRDEMKKAEIIAAVKAA